MNFAIHLSILANRTKLPGFISLIYRYFGGEMTSCGIEFLILEHDIFLHSFKFSLISLSNIFTRPYPGNTITIDDITNRIFCLHFNL